MHSANELRFKADILDADSTTVLATGVACGFEDLEVRRDNEQQFTIASSTHVFVFRYLDASPLKSTSYIRMDGVLYIVDGVMDPYKPRPKQWREAHVHAQRMDS